MKRKLVSGPKYAGSPPDAQPVIELSQNDQRVLVDALTSPPEPNMTLRRAWARQTALTEH